MLRKGDTGAGRPLVNPVDVSPVTEEEWKIFREKARLYEETLAGIQKEVSANKFSLYSRIAAQYTVAGLIGVVKGVTAAGKAVAEGGCIVGKAFKEEWSQQSETSQKERSTNRKKNRRNHRC